MIQTHNNAAQVAMLTCLKQSPRHIRPRSCVRCSAAQIIGIGFEHVIQSCMHEGKNWGRLCGVPGKAKVGRVDNTPRRRGDPSLDDTNFVSGYEDQASSR